MKGETPKDSPLHSWDEVSFPHLPARKSEGRPLVLLGNGMLEEIDRQLRDLFQAVNFPATQY
jgi:hypothetical protein